VGTREAYQKVLERACIIAGHETALAKQLQVPVWALVDWLLGDAPVPPEVFLRAVDVVTAANRKKVKDNRALLDQIKLRHRR
jgi:hypothetical protein